MDVLIVLVVGVGFPLTGLIVSLFSKDQKMQNHADTEWLEWFFKGK